MLEILHAIATWLAVIWICIVVLFPCSGLCFGHLDLPNRFVGFFVELFEQIKPLKSPYKLKITKSSLRFHERACAPPAIANSRTYTSPLQQTVNWHSSTNLSTNETSTHGYSISIQNHVRSHRVIGQLKTMPYRKDERD